MESDEYVEGESDQTVLLDDERVCRWRSQGVVRLLRGWWAVLYAG